METKTQITVAVFTALAGVLLGVLVAGLAFCYRRRRDLDGSRRYGVRYRRHASLSSENDTVNIDFRQRNSRNYSNNIEEASERHEDEQISEIELRPKVHQPKWNKWSSKNDWRKASTSRDSYNKSDTRTLEVVSRRVNSIEMRNMHRPHTWAEGYDMQETSELTYSMGRHSPENAKTTRIPRPIVRPQKSELFEDRRSSAHHFKRDRQTSNMSSLINSAAEFY